MDELINVQFADDTSLFLCLTEENFDNAIRRLDFFCKAYGSKIAPAKSTILGWQQDSPDWLVSKGWNWVRPNEVIRYLGIPFSVEPNLNSMWEWIYNKISRKHVKWKTHSLSIVGRF